MHPLYRHDNDSCGRTQLTCAHLEFVGDLFAVRAWSCEFEYVRRQPSNIRQTVVRCNLRFDLNVDAGFCSASR